MLQYHPLLFTFVDGRCRCCLVSTKPPESGCFVNVLSLVIYTCPHGALMQTFEVGLANLPYQTSVVLLSATCPIGLQIPPEKVGLGWIWGGSSHLRICAWSRIEIYPIKQNDPCMIHVTLLVPLRLFEEQTPKKTSTNWAVPRAESDLVADVRC